MKQSTAGQKDKLQGMENSNGIKEEPESLLLSDALQSDPRPSLVIDLQDSAHDLPRPRYCNSALLSQHELLDAIRDPGKDAAHSEALSQFSIWVRGDSVIGAHAFQDHLWTQTTIRKRWRLVQGIPQIWIPQSLSRNSSGLPAPSKTHSTLDTMAGAVDPFVTAEHARTQLPEKSRRELEAIKLDGRDVPPHRVSDNHYDCTAIGSVKTTAHIDYMQQVDWSKTPLGPIDTWDPPLRTMVNTVMDDPLPAALYVGPEYVMIYNEAFVPLVHKNHPAAFGTNAPNTQREYWGAFEGIIETNLHTGKAVSLSHLQLFLRRNGILEETYFSFSFLPVVGTEGRIIAHYERINETTREVISERRMSTLLNAGQETAVVRDQGAFWGQVLTCLHSNDKDVPFALVYSVGEGNDPTVLDGIKTNPLNLPLTSRQCLLRGLVGIPEDHHAAYPMLDFQEGDKGWAPFFRSALAASHPVVFHKEDHVQLRELLRGIESRTFGDRITSVVVSPITPTAHENILAFLVIGLNPRTPYNEDYEQFIHVASRLIETSLASVVLLEEEVRTRERMALQAAEVQEKLAAELKTSRLEIQRREQKFQRFAERSGVGIFVLDSHGDYTYRNPAWYDILQPGAEDINVRNAWLKLVEPEDVQQCEDLFKTLYQDKQNITFELRLKRSWNAPQDMQDQTLVSESRTWILCSAYPELTEDGEVLEILGSVIDVSKQKFGEGLQRQRTTLALESKRRLENFIDTTSHEMRNPLTAIIQCADGIIQSHINLLQTTDHAVSVTLDHLETSLDNAQTIVQCAQHQKRIVDDILTMSKLDSDLLTITPVSMQPSELATRSVKMLESEARAADVDMRFEVEASYYDLGVEWVSLDPTRLLQVLINLITNAIKFTRLEDLREVVVSIGASLLEQPNSAHGVQYIRRATGKSMPDQTPTPSTGQDLIYVHFTVRDTGRGLSTEEKDLIFTRFSQASPKTHIHYGGSGLGLFISRRLVEMQGGAIGFSSERKAGSTSSFYVKAPRVAPDDDQTSPLRTVRSRSLSQAPSYPEAPQISAMPYQPPRQTTAAQRHVSTRSDDIQSVVVSPMASPTSKSQFGPPAAATLAAPIMYILVVEDNLVNQRVLAKQLTGLGCAVAVANHGAEALTYLQDTVFWNGEGQASDAAALSLVFMDWEMPVMDGLTCVKRIRELQREGVLIAHVPIIGVTANARPEQLDQATAAGMDDVVTKPFRVSEVLGRMKALLARLDSVI